MVELAWAAQLLPFGYATVGALLTWIWYILQLLVRFHFSERGVDWKKQIPFLVGNIVLMILFLEKTPREQP